MNNLRYIYESSLVKTLAAKHQTKTKKIYKNYTMYTANGKKVIGVNIPRKGKKPLVAAFGRKPIRRKHEVIMKDEIPIINTGRNELIERMLAAKCELCGREGDVEGHHLRKLKDLKKKYQGRKEPPEWVKRMIAIKRKTLFICDTCHQKIHNGTYDGIKLT